MFRSPLLTQVRWLAGAAVVLVAGAIGAPHVADPEPEGRGAGLPRPPAVAHFEDAIRRQPMAFVANRGQWNRRALYRMQRGPATTWFMDDGWTTVLQVPDSDPEPGDGGGSGRGAADHAGRAVAVRLTFEGRSTDVRVRGEAPLTTSYNFLLGQDRSNWHRDVAAFGKLRYTSLYHGIDVVARQQGQMLEYDLLLEPGADAGLVTVRCAGVEGLRIDGDGSLVMETAFGPIRQSPPTTWSVLPDGRQRPVECRFRLIDGSRYGFVVPDHDASLALVIDPGIDWSTYVGGSQHDVVIALDQDAAGRVTIAGFSYSQDLPTTTGAHRVKYPGGTRAAFVARLDPNQTGSAQLMWCTYLGGTGEDIAYDVAVTGSGTSIVAGYTSSGGFPVTNNAFQATAGGGGDGFITELDAGGRTLLYSTYLHGGAQPDWITTVAPDASGVLTIGGSTGSTTFPVTAGAFDASFNGGVLDNFVARFDPRRQGGAQMVACTYLGGTGKEGFGPNLWRQLDMQMGQVLNGPGGTILVTGSTVSRDFPTTANAYQTFHSGGSGTDIYFARFDATLSVLQYSTLFGGASGDDSSFHMAARDNGDVYLSGLTWSRSFPTTPGAYDTVHGGLNDAILVVLRPLGLGQQDLIYSSLIGGSSWDSSVGIAVDAAGVATLSGWTGGGITATAGAFQTVFPGIDSGFVARLDPGGRGVDDLHYLTFLGGSSTSGHEWSDELVVDGAGRATILGNTDAKNFPTTVGAYQGSNAGGVDGTVTRMDLLPAGAVPHGKSTSGCRGPIWMQVNSNPSPGNLGFTLLCNDAPPSAAGVLLLGARIAGAPLLNVTLHASPTVVLFVSSTSAGASRLPVSVPASVPVGVKVSVQFVWANTPACTNGGLLSASNALELTL